MNRYLSKIKKNLYNFFVYVLPIWIFAVVFVILQYIADKAMGVL